MRFLSRLLALSLGLVLRVSANEQVLTALRKPSPDPNQKLFADDLAFTYLSDLLASETAPSADLQDESLDLGDATQRFYYPAFGLHYDGEESDLLRRAADVRRKLERRSSCPSGMENCADIGSSDKCCQEGTYCTYVTDSTVGHVACCPDETTCGGRVGSCPSDAVTCPSDLGGGCCIAGYVCQGDGCVVSASASQGPTTETTVESTTHTQPPETVTTIETTVVRGSPTTVIVTVAVTRTSSQRPKTLTTTQTVGPTSTATGTGTGVPPFRPVSSSSAVTSSAGETQSGCPVGYYGCLATHGGGCCRTDRDCQTFSCPAVSSTTVVSDGNTIVMPATGAESTTTATCAGGWFMCGAAGGPVAGCCPSGYSCGTASCFTSKSSQTASVQKELPGQGAAARGSGISLTLLSLFTGSAFLLMIS